MLTNHFTDQETDTHYIYTYTVILSRYLYSITDVKQSLFLSILEHNQEQAMFWGYELYFSGFQEETFDYLLEIARILFQIDFLDCDEDNDMIDFVNYCKYLWNLSQQNSHNAIGTCISCMCNHNHNLAPFIKKYFQKDIIKVKYLSKNKYVNMKLEDVEKYTPTYSNIPCYKILKHARKYAVNKIYNKLFKTYIPENPNHIYFDNWLYHASLSPIWNQRITEYGGITDDKNKKIIFDSEDLEEEFYNKWNYEPDEQSLETQQKVMGNPNDLQQDLESFCIQYGYKMKECELDERNPDLKDTPVTHTDILVDTNSTPVNCGGVIHRFKKRVI